jgi:nucleotidyltransferase substrate binding protein (TIGR01987 family)
VSDSKSGPLSDSLTRASAFLSTVLAAPESEIQRAAAIQAFEFTYALAWKLQQSRLHDEGLSLASPRAVFRAAGDVGLIDSVERWFGYLDARNLTVHTYNDQTAAQLYAVIVGGFLSDVKRLLPPASSDR